MANEKIFLFVDTNAFIQLKDLKDIPWRKLFPKVKEVEILVSSAVIEELDDFKIGKNKSCLLYTSPSPRDQRGSRMPSSA